MNSTVQKFAVLLALPAAIVLGLALRGLAQAAAAGQTPASPAMNRSVVVLDPAHGGPDTGATLGERLLEKDVTLALSARLKTALTAAGFTVVLTRDADSLTILPADQRVETANRARALACLVIHATGTGSGVHLYGSNLEAKETAATDDSTQEFEPVPWDNAQAEWVGRSQRLEDELSAALGRAGIPVVAGKEPVRPLDNMTCPALAVEVAPLVVSGQDTAPVTDPPYQQRLVSTLTAALQAWRTENAAGAAGRGAGAGTGGGAQ